MKLFFYAIWVSLIVLCVGCHKHIDEVSEGADSDLCDPVKMHPSGRGALLLSRFDSFDSLKRVINISYHPSVRSWGGLKCKTAFVSILHCSGSRKVNSILSDGMKESAFHKAKASGFFAKCGILFRCPFAGIHYKSLKDIEELGRRRPWIYGKGDVAFYDIAEAMVVHINPTDTSRMTAKDLSEKGFLNTFNHITAQAFMTSFFSEDVAEFVADVHERQTMPELITGAFTDQQIMDLENGVVDNYVDMINNEWGQELGKQLKIKYKINSLEDVTPYLLVNYLNDIQSYQSSALHINFYPFRPDDQIVVNFIRKIKQLI